MKRLSRQILFLLLRQMLFWLIIFDLSRIVFIFYNLNYIKGSGFLDLLGSFWYSIPLDFSAICYIMALPFFLLIVQNFYSAKWIDIINKTYTFIILLILVILTTAEAGIYSEWKTKLHYKALLYLAHPEEITRTAQTWQIMVFAALVAFQMAAYFFLYLRVFFSRIIVTKKMYFFSAAFILLTPVVLFWGMRGGFRQIPINQSESYYSKNEILNLISVNSLWNLGSSIKRNSEMLEKNPYHYYNDAEACNTVDQLFKYSTDSTQIILKTARPNIVMFILEGWTADLIESQGGEEGITPFFHELEKTGVLFTNIYTNGTRSQEGMSAIFSGFPAQTITTITQQPEKYNKLPSLIQKLKKAGYFSSFYFGGQLNYGNIKSFLVANGFDKIQEDSDFPDSFPRAKLGIHDEYTFPYFLEELNKNKQPFFSSIFTISTHSPYDFEMQEVISWPKYEKKYVNAAFYADKCLERFFQQAQKQPWYNNTLFVLVSDHSHGSYHNYHFCSPDYHKIVLLLCGNVIKEEFRGTQNTKIGSQTDLPAVLSAQLGLDYSDFKWSKNLLAPHSPEFAFFAFNDGFGWIRPGGYVTYDAANNTNCMLSIDSTATFSEDELVKQAKSYMQCSFQQYMNF
ncbi:MAG TPA: sulfatase-like hydrolase/transferase [Bacteroidales bacterium]|nr:sulfatase-like hydrolase/transferase [Bacteroidales bacterium]